MCDDCHGFVGVSILSVSASDDDDSPDNKQITFSIIGGDPEGVFSMENQETNIGNIVLKSPLDRETQDSYRLVIQASDGGTPSKSTTTTVSSCILLLCWQYLNADVEIPSRYLYNSLRSAKHNISLIRDRNKLYLFI